MKVARKAPAIPSTVVRRKPLGSFGPGESTRAIRPAMKPITMIQMMFDTSTSLDYDLSLPPTSSVATLAGHRATVVQTPTASPIVVAVPRGVVTTHCRSWRMAHSRCEACWLLYEPRRLLDRAWRDSLPRATSGDTQYQWSSLSDPLGSIRRM